MEEDKAHQGYAEHDLKESYDVIQHTATLPHALLLCMRDGVLRGPYQLDERLNLEARPAYKCAVDIFLGHDLSRVLRLDRAAVEDSNILCEVVPFRLPQQ